MTVATNRLPGWTLAVPLLALGAGLVLRGSGTVMAGVVLGVALLAAVHHAEVVALFAVVLLALSFMMALITYGTGHASLLSGVVHLILLAIWLFLIIAP